MYNVRSYVGQCIESLRRQTFRDFQVICIDDGSTDDTLYFAQDAAKGDERFSFVSQANAGQSAARNVGIERATGKYLLFLDSDDYYEERALQTLYDRAERDGLDDLFFTARSEYENSRTRKRYRDDYDNREDICGNMTGRELLVRFAETDSFCVSPAMQLIRRDFLESSGIRFYEGIVHEDNLFTCMMLAHARRAAFMNEPLYVRRVRPGSTMTEERGIKHVYGHFKSAYELEAWLRTDIRGTRAFDEALLRHIAFCYDLAAFDALSIDEEALDERACQLLRDEELSFRLHVIEHAREMRGVRKEYIESMTYRMGRAILALPCWLKERIGR